MGVPSFYRWLVSKYPKIASDAIQQEMDNDVDCCNPNPNGVEFDNLYLDMNGIIHPCFHPEDDEDNEKCDCEKCFHVHGPLCFFLVKRFACDTCTFCLCQVYMKVFGPTTYDEVFKSIHEYIDRLFNIVRPRKLLYMAIDGVAPRAKMNQQRARRFRSARDVQMAEEIEIRLREQFEKEGKALLPKEESELADSNVITPGTEFMDLLSQDLQGYIRLRMSENRAWNIKVILSDDKVPGEGEHKIMSFIRAQRSSIGHDPNTRHCLYGLDADLIMLALATHEIHFAILREEVLSPSSRLGHFSTVEYTLHKAEKSSLTSRGWFKENPWQKWNSESVAVSGKPVLCKKDASVGTNRKQTYQFLHVWVLREYLALDFKINSPSKSEYDLERIIDDFIFICFFAGNDFLPHMPTLEIHEGCIDLLMHVYKKEFENLGGYLVDMQKVDDSKGGYLKLKRIERFILTVGQYEEQIFRKRSILRERKLRRILTEHNDDNDYENENCTHDYGIASESVDPSAATDVYEFQVLNNTKELKQKLKSYIRRQADLFKDGHVGTDKIKYGTMGWKDRYYKEKFSAESPDETETIRKAVVGKYCEGLQWVLLYYFSGVPSWTWFYPYHYGPAASDLKGLSQSKVKFQKGLPFKPFDQLMGVLPPRSAHALPAAYKRLMIDENSNIIDFYPTEFDTDTDGKRFAWQGICKLPFIDGDRLLVETRKLESELKDHEKIRNSQTLDHLFVKCSSESTQQSVLQGGTRASSDKLKGGIRIDSTLEGIKGNVHLMPEDLIETDDDSMKQCDRHDICLFYETHQGSHHIPRLLEGVEIPEETIEESDIVETTLWHEHHGYSTNYNTRVKNQRWTQKDCNSESNSKGAGTGFALGRGKLSPVHFVQSHDNFPKHSTRKPVVDLEPGAPRYVAYNGKLKATGLSRAGDCAGIGSLQISEPSQRRAFRPSQAGTGIWSTHGASDTNQDWRPSKQYAAAPGASWQRDNGGRRDETRGPSHPFPGGTGRGRGRGRGPYGASDTNQDWRSSKQYATAPVASWQRENGGRQDETRGTSHPFPGGTGRGRGRGRGPYGASDTDQDWKSSKQYAAAPGASWQRENGGRQDETRGPYHPFPGGTGRGRGRGRGPYVPEAYFNRA